MFTGLIWHIKKLLTLQHDGSGLPKDTQPLILLTAFALLIAGLIQIIDKNPMEITKEMIFIGILVFLIFLKKLDKRVYAGMLLINVVLTLLTLPFLYLPNSNVLDFFLSFWIGISYFSLYDKNEKKQS